MSLNTQLVFYFSKEEFFYLPVLQHGTDLSFWILIILENLFCEFHWIFIPSVV